jgi:cytosine/adenosine deaminase-related metal-dependent hydrolase
MLKWTRAVSLINGRILTPDGEAASVRVRRRVLSIDEPPRHGDLVVDLDGRFVIPGLVNAHDHLELNHYGPLKCREQYGNAGEWIDDLKPVIGTNPHIRARSRHPLVHRLFIGGLKNQLAGVTTVAHHNPLYRELAVHFPVGVVTRFGWAHSLGMEQRPVGAHGEPGGRVVERALATPGDRPFIVHAAEGVDAAAASEIGVLERGGALRETTVLVHGLAIEPERWRDLFARGVSLVWCPASNIFLFGRTLCMRCVLGASDGRDGTPARRVPARTPVCLGSDSRVTGSRDLLEELKVAAGCRVAADRLLEMVTSSAADVLRLGDAGRIRVGAVADLTVIPPVARTAAESLLRCNRADLCLVVRNGTPMVGDTALMTAFAAGRVHVTPVMIDEVPKLMEAGVARRIERCIIDEPGVACDRES